MQELENEMKETLITLTSDIVAAHVSNNDVAVDDVPGLITNVFGALSGLGTAAEAVEERPEPAVSVRASIKPDYIVCLEDGKKLKMLKRYLRTNYDMTPEEYRARWNLPSDYPMVAPNYAEKRRDLAKNFDKIMREKMNQEMAHNKTLTEREALELAFRKLEEENSDLNKQIEALQVISLSSYQ